MLSDGTKLSRRHVLTTNTAFGLEKTQNKARRSMHGAEQPEKLRMGQNEALAPEPLSSGALREVNVFGGHRGDVKCSILSL